MTASTPQSSEANESKSDDQLLADGAGDADGTDGTAADPRQAARRSVPPGLQADVLERDNHQCQVCGRCGPECGGLATLHVHHMQRDPDGIDVNALSNLTTLCRPCHNWVHQRALPDQLPVTVTAADMTELSPTDIDIVRFLAADGPAGTGAVRDAVTAELSLGAVREHLERLMALDSLVEVRDQQLIARDRETGTWGLPAQIDASARGYVPDDHRTFAQRFEDEQIRRALDAGHDRETVAEVFDVSLRSTYHKYKRAYAYEFPLDEFRRSGAGGQHPAAATSDVADETMTESDTGADADVGTAVEMDSEAGSDADADGLDLAVFDDVDPEVVQMVREVIRKQFDDD